MHLLSRNVITVYYAVSCVCHYRSSCRQGRCPSWCLLLPLLCAAHYGVSLLSLTHSNCDWLHCFISILTITQSLYCAFHWLTHTSHLQCFVKWHFLPGVWSVSLGVHIRATQWPGHHRPAGIAGAGDHHEQGRWVLCVCVFRLAGLNTSFERSLSVKFWSLDQWY